MPAGGDQVNIAMKLRGQQGDSLRVELIGATMASGFENDLAPNHRIEISSFRVSQKGFRFLAYSTTTDRFVVGSEFFIVTPL